MLVPPRGKSHLMAALGIEILLARWHIAIRFALFATICCFVYSYLSLKLDLFRPNLTVREHLLFNARLRMDARCTDEQIISRVEEVFNTTVFPPHRIIPPSVYDIFHRR